MEKLRLSALTLVALLSLVLSPAAAVGGYDIAHIVERTCEPGGPLIVTDAWKSRQDRDRVTTEPGEVIACPPAGPKSSFQIAAGPERIGGQLYLCTYFSLFNGDGADTCSATDSGDNAGPFVKPLMTIRADKSGRLGLSGIVSDDVAAVAIAPVATVAPEPMMVPIDRTRAARLGATRAFGYFSLTVDSESLCAAEPARVLARDGSGGRVAASTVPLSTQLLDVADGVTYARSLKALCRPRSPSEPVESPWSTEGALLRSLLGLLI
jgi:hypothetical protein